LTIMDRGLGYSIRNRSGFFLERSNMPIYCYNRQNRTEPRSFTARDAARVLLYAYRSGATLDEFLTACREVGEGELKTALEDAIRVEAQRLLCPAFRDATARVDAALARLNPVMASVRAIVDVADGALSQIEDLSIAGISVPDFFTRFPRRIVEHVLDLIDAVDNTVAQYLDLFGRIQSFCPIDDKPKGSDDGQDQNE